MEAEKQKTDSEAEHLRRADSFQLAEMEVQKLEKRLHKHIQKSRPYFEQKDVFNKVRNWHFVFMASVIFTMGDKVKRQKVVK
jgi:hypothetical protein